MLNKILKAITLMIIFFLSIFNASFGDNGNHENLNRYFNKYLNDKKLNFEEARIGDKVRFNSVFVLPALGERGLLTIEYKRDDFAESFIEDLFYLKKDKLSHLLTSEGFEAILDNDKIIINVYSGVVIKWSREILNSKNHKVFNSDEPIGVITNLSGNVMYSCDYDLIKNNLNEFYVTYRGPLATNEKIKKSDGAIEVVPIKIESDMWLPPKYKPKILN